VRFKVSARISRRRAGAKLFRRSKPDLILAVGGSVLDVAKLIGILSARIVRPVTCGAKKLQNGVGNRGAHRRHRQPSNPFAVVFLRTKYSVAHPLCAVCPYDLGGMAATRYCRGHGPGCLLPGSGVSVEHQATRSRVCAGKPSGPDEPPHNGA
jgi:hypothetical protein